MELSGSRRQSCASPIASTSTAKMVAVLRRIPARLIAFGAHNVERLRTSGIEGYLLTNWEAQFPAIKSALKWEADRFQSMFKWSDAA